jgi:hypothetical protein
VRFDDSLLYETISHLPRSAAIALAAAISVVVAAVRLRRIAEVAAEIRAAGSAVGRPRRGGDGV